MNIGLDIMGGDYAPEEAIKGLISYLESNDSINRNDHFFLFGNLEKTKPFLPLLSNWKSNYTLINCETVIGMHEHPTKALKEKSNSSIAVGYQKLANREIDAFASAGNTGAMLVGALYSVKAIEGVIRPTIASPIPKLDGAWNFLVDAGANADCKPEHLAQFAVMGSLYAEEILKIKQPKVGLLNLGAEEGKGNILAQATYPILKNMKNINFSGNMEGRDVFLNKADVIVTEGFTGNILLKMAESFYEIFSLQLNYKDEFLDKFNYESFGGTPVLGVNAPVFIGHGISKKSAFHSMIRNTIQLAESGLVEIFQENFRPK